MPEYLQVVGAVLLVIWILLAAKRLREEADNDDDDTEDVYDDARWRAKGFKGL